ncbi:MAG: DUF3987 domain-containing protein [Planctomycetaceae bacterium]|nr:DUF3987 domain-containing protein [Planctomycetaceae bacterium]
MLRADVCGHDDLLNLAKNMARDYVPPTACQWFMPPAIHDAGEVDMAGWVATENAPSDSCRKSLLDSGYVACQHRGRAVYMPAVQYGECVTAGWRGEWLLFGKEALTFTSPDEAKQFWAAVIHVAENAAAALAPHVFDYWRVGFTLQNERQLLNRIAGIESKLAGSTDAKAVRDAISDFDALLREADQQADNEEIVAWYAGRDSDEDTPYWRDCDRFGQELQAIKDERKQAVRKLLDQEKAQEEAHMKELLGGTNAVLRGAVQSDSGESAPSPLAGQSAESIKGQIEKAMAPILAGVSDAQVLDVMCGLADCLRGAADRERASGRQWRPFPLDALPRRIGGFVQAVAEAHSVDPVFVVLPVLATVAAAMGNAWRLRIKDDFDVPPVLWCFLVARTGTNKSGPFAVAVGPMWQVPPMPSAGDAMLSVRQEQYIIDDATSEAVLARLGKCPRGLLLAGDELAGWLQSFDAYRKGAGGDQQKWIRMWNAKPIRVDRKTTDERNMIPAPAVSIAGSIQPELLSKAADAEKLASGFFPRALAAMPPEQKRRWSNVGISEQQAAFWRKLIDRLRTTPFDSLETDTGQYLPKIVTLSPEADAAWVQWYEEVAERLHHLTGTERAITAKADVQAARLAFVLYGMACALDEYPAGCHMPGPIMAAGVRLAEWFLDETLRVFETTCGRAQGERVPSLLSLVQRRGGKATPRDIQRADSRSYPSAEAARVALQDLADAGHGSFDGRVFVVKQGKGKP